MKHLSSFDNLVNPPTFPMPWRPSERGPIKDKLFHDNLDTDEDIRPYLREMDTHYVVTGIGVQALRMAIGHMGIGAEVFYGRESTGRHPDDVQRDFEQKVLGLEPNPYGDGLRHSESSAGFGGGNYPIDAFADLANTDAETFRAILSDKEATKFGHIIVRSANYIVPVKNNTYDQTLVYADRVTELSEEGQAMLKIALSIADYSSRNS